ncbi:MAG: citramalate synthase [Bacteroidetes bacterium QH_1_64_81]|nr:MAG: citramalate synthase [Bacteroidetes bacterium QH_1_64_81]
MPKIELFDTTLRDGTQGEHVTLSARDKMRIARRLDAFGIDVIEGGWPGSNPKDQAFFEQARNAEWPHASICAFGSTRHASNPPPDDDNLQALIDANADVVSIFGKSWTLHVEQALGVSLETNLELIRSSVAFLREHGTRVIGADTLVLCDTNGGSLPHDIREVTTTVHKELDTTLGIHAHNDGDCAVANSLAAVRAGARHVQGTINGLGERCGNADLCAVIPDLQLKMGYDCVPEDRLADLTDLSRFTDEVANIDPDDGAPFVGRSAFTHKGGVHVSAVMKEPSTYEHIEPDAVGNRRAAAQAVERIKELEHLGYEFQGAEASFELLLRTLQGEVPDFFELDRMRVWSGQDDTGEQTVEASLALTVQDQRKLAVAEGNGPVDALSNAMQEALCSFYPHLDDLRLSDYKVRVLTPQDGTAATVRVLIEHSDGASTWNTVGVSENILDASWQALADGVRYALFHSTADAVTDRARNPAVSA